MLTTSFLKKNAKKITQNRQLNSYTRVYKSSDKPDAYNCQNHRKNIPKI